MAAREKPKPIANVERDDLTDDEIHALEYPHNADNPKAIRAKEKAQTDEDKMIENMLAGMLAVAEGRAFLGWLLLDLCGMFRPFEVVAQDLNLSHVRIGARNVGLQVHEKLLKADAKQYMAVLADRMHKG